MASVLVTGGAGYIGSHTVFQLVEAGHQVIVLDNLYSGHRWAVDPRAKFCQGDIQDTALVLSLLRDNSVDAVIHFAGHIVVPESVTDPLKYYKNNVVGSLSLIQACVDAQINRFVFSSSAAVYGAPQESPINETTLLNPINPYGATKLMTEWTLRDVAATHDLQYVALRYFNVAGAHSNGKLGQTTPEATHLIKVACETAVGKRNSMSIFGQDYSTIDGTCVRDYIHVEDLANAHLDALDYLAGGGDSVQVNCGYGRGFSVSQVVDCVKQVSGCEFSVELAARRAGDPAELVADNQRIKDLFGWIPRFDDLEVICRSAYEWEQTLEKTA